MGNGEDGIVIQGATSVVIGGTTVAERNVISSNSTGINIGGSNSVGFHSVTGNYIGTKADGTGDLGNGGGDGILISGSDGNTIGSGLAGAGNLISNSGFDGIGLTNGSSANGISNNIITANRANGIGALSGPNGIAANQIFGNAKDGISVSPTVSGIDIGGNQIFGNGELGIDLVGGTADSFGVTSNDSGDFDSGANQLQNYPVLTLAQRDLSAGTAIVQRDSQQCGKHSVSGSTSFLSWSTPSGHGEGPDAARPRDHHDRLDRKQDLHFYDQQPLRGTGRHGNGDVAERG